MIRGDPILRDGFLRSTNFELATANHVAHSPPLSRGTAQSQVILATGVKWWNRQRILPLGDQRPLMIHFRHWAQIAAICIRMYQDGSHSLMFGDMLNLISVSKP